MIAVTLLASMFFGLVLVPCVLGIYVRSSLPRREPGATPGPHLVSHGATSRAG